jgi:hypothetical protein
MINSPKDSIRRTLMKPGHSSRSSFEVPLEALAPQVRREFEVAGAKLDGGSFDVDSHLVGLADARRRPS